MTLLALSDILFLSVPFPHELASPYIIIELKYRHKPNSFQHLNMSFSFLYFCEAICKRCRGNLTELMADFSLEPTLTETPCSGEPPFTSVESEVTPSEIPSSEESEKEQDEQVKMLI